MVEQQTSPRKSVVLAVLIFVFAAAVFAAAFYLFDGMTLVDDFMASDPFGTEADGSEDEADPVIPDKPDTSDVSVVRTDALQLPDGMAEEFALRLWQEQIDSQVNIQKLVDGEVASFELGAVGKGSELATIPITVEFTDGSSAPGDFVLRRVGDAWYTAYIGGLRRADTGGAADSVSQSESAVPSTQLPDTDEVDIELLNTLIVQQMASRAVLDEYADGVIRHVTVTGVTQGAGTRTIEIEMTETHETGHGEIVCISREVKGETFWFVARFTKL